MKLVNLIQKLGLEPLFNDFQWYRKSVGGIWLKYAMGFPVYSLKWYNVVEYDGAKPSDFCIGNPLLIEQYS